MLTTRLVRYKSKAGALHVVHEQESRPLSGAVNTLCGHRFELSDVESFKNKFATCRACADRDNPFSMSQNQEVLFWKIAQRKPDGRLAADLVCRDLFVAQRSPDGTITERPQLSAKGEVLARDFLECVPWQAFGGTFHARRAMHRSKSVCGAPLYGLDSMTYTRLAQLMELHKDAKVDCIDCLADPHHA